jgi:hypothetical protein
MLRVTCMKLFSVCDEISPNVERLALRGIAGIHCTPHETTVNAFTKMFLGRQQDL